MDNKAYKNIYGEDIGNPNANKPRGNRFSEIEGILDSGETVIIDDSKISEIFELISALSQDDTILIEEDDIENIIETSWYNSELEISQWKSSDISNIKKHIIIHSIEQSEKINEITFTKREILTINRLINNFLRFVEKDNIHIEYVLNHGVPYSTFIHDKESEQTVDVLTIPEPDPKKSKKIQDIEYRSFGFGMLIFGFWINKNMDIGCDFTPLPGKTLLSYGRL